MSDGAGGAPRLDTQSSSAQETESIGAALARALLPGDMVLLAGDLGAGKTTFTKGLARALGVTDVVTSPTFTLVRTYSCTPGPSGVGTLVHADLFRLDSLQEVVDLAIGELLESDAVAVVEWGDVGAPVLDQDAFVVSLFQGRGSDERTITFAPPPSWERRTEELVRALSPWRPSGSKRVAGEGE